MSILKANEIEESYRLYGRHVYLYAFSLCKDHHQAEDLTMSTFCKALLSLDENCTSLKHWLLRVCRNLFVDDFRKQKQKQRYVQDQMHFADPPLEKDPLITILQAESQHRLYSALMTLSPPDREILTLFYFLDYSILQITAHTGRSQSAVKTGLHRARIRLKNVLKEELQ